MPVIQFSVPSEVYLQLMELGTQTGLSEHLVAKYLTVESLEALDEKPARVLEQRRSYQRHHMDRKRRAKPLG